MRRTTKKRVQESFSTRIGVWVLAFLLGLASWFVPRGPISLGLEFFAAAIFALGTVWPRYFRWLISGLNWLRFRFGRRQVEV